MDTGSIFGPPEKGSMFGWSDDARDDTHASHALLLGGDSVAPNAREGRPCCGRVGARGLNEPGVVTLPRDGPAVPRILGRCSGEVFASSVDGEPFGGARSK